MINTCLVIYTQQPSIVLPIVLNHERPTASRMYSPLHPCRARMVTTSSGPMVPTNNKEKQRSPVLRGKTAASSGAKPAATGQPMSVLPGFSGFEGGDLTVQALAPFVPAFPSTPTLDDSSGTRKSSSRKVPRSGVGSTAVPRGSSLWRLCRLRRLCGL